jgi:hypothetical protein
MSSSPGSTVTPELDLLSDGSPRRAGLAPPQTSVEIVYGFTTELNLNLPSLTARIVADFLGLWNWSKVICPEYLIPKTFFGLQVPGYRISDSFIDWSGLSAAQILRSGCAP